MARSVCTVHQVEECKSVVNLVPIWAAMLMVNAVQAQLGSLTVTQALYMNLSIGSFNIPPASLVAASLVTFIVTIPTYDLVILPKMRRWTNNPRGINLLVKIGLGMGVLVMTFVLAGLVEHKRRSAAHHGVILPFYWILPQCVFLGLGDTFFVIGQFEFYYDQLPISLRSMSGALFWSALAVGTYLSNLILLAVHRSTNWLPVNLNEGRIDYFYYSLACITVVNIFFYLLCAKRYKYVRHHEDGPPTATGGQFMA